MTPDVEVHPMEISRILRRAIKQVEEWRKDLQTKELKDLFEIPEYPKLPPPRERKPGDWDKYHELLINYFKVRRKASRKTSIYYLTKLHQMYAHLQGKLHTPRKNLVWYELENEDQKKQALSNGGTLTVDYNLEMQFADIPSEMWKEVIIEFREF